MLDIQTIIDTFEDEKELLWTDDDLFTSGYNNGIEAGKNLALEMFKSVEPIKPKAEKALLDYQSWHYVCGDCEKPIDIQDNFCRHCGRPIEHT